MSLLEDLIEHEKRNILEALECKLPPDKLVENFLALEPCTLEGVGRKAKVHRNLVLKYAMNELPECEASKKIEKALKELGAESVITLREDGQHEDAR